MFHCDVVIFCNVHGAAATTTTTNTTTAAAAAATNPCLVLVV